MLQYPLMGFDIEASVVPIGSWSRSHPVLGMISSFPSHSPFHLGNDFNPAHSGFRDLKHRLKTQITQLSGPSHYLNFCLAFHSTKLCHNVIYPFEALA